MDSSVINPPVTFESVKNNPYSTLLESLYASLSSHKGFETFLHCFKTHFNSSSAALMAIARDSKKMRWSCIAGVPSHTVQWYQEHDVAVKDVGMHLLESLGSNIEGFIAAGLLLNDAELAESLKPWLQQDGMFDTAGLIINASEKDYLLLVLERNELAGKFQEYDIDQLNFFASQIKQVAQLFVKFYHQQQSHDTLLEVMQSLSQATMVVNEFLDIQHINPAAEAALGILPTIHIINNKLVIEQQSVNERLLLEVAYLVCDEGNTEPASIVFISQDEQAITITLTAMAAAAGESGSRSVLLQIHHPDQQSLPQAGQIQVVFKLSQTEALLCQLLVEGYTLKGIARKRDVSIHTVREQMRQIYQKTGYNRQAELVAAILRIVV